MYGGGVSFRNSTPPPRDASLARTQPTPPPNTARRVRPILLLLFSRGLFIILLKIAEPPADTNAHDERFKSKRRANILIRIYRNVLPSIRPFRRYEYTSATDIGIDNRARLVNIITGLEIRD